MTDHIDITARGNCFKLLAACFYEPDKNLFIEEQVCENLKNLLNSWAADAARAAGDMELNLKICSQEQLSIDHAVLFVGPFELIAAPYGSVYIEKMRTVMGESTVSAARFYQAEGLSVDMKEPPDHIAIELEFMYYLSIKEAAAASAGQSDDVYQFREKQKSFYFSALKPWAAIFCQAIRVGTDNRFYIKLADCLDHFLISCEQRYNAEYAVKTG